MILRKAVPSDVNALVKLMHDHSVYERGLSRGVSVDSILALQRGIAKQLKNHDAGFFVLEHEGKIRGFLNYRIDRADDEKIGRIQNLFITAPGRGKGYGSALVHRCLAYFKERKCARTTTFVRAGNKRAQSFWGNHGFSLDIGYFVSKPLP